MIRKSTATWCITLVAALGVMGCRSDKDRNAQDQGQTDPQKRADQPQQQPSDQKTSDNLLKEKDEYRTNLEKAITDQQKSIDDMRQGAASATGETKVEDEHELQDVLKRRDTLQSDMRDVAMATPDKWPALKDKIDRDIDEYKDTVKTASSRIKATPGRAQQQPTATPPNTATGTSHAPPPSQPTGAPTTTQTAPGTGTTPQPQPQPTK